MTPDAGTQENALVIEALDRLTTEPLLSDPGRHERECNGHTAQSCTPETEATTSAGIVEEAAALLPPAEAWPVLDPAAWHGLAGDVFRLLDPHTEADHVALLLTFLSEFGCLLGRAPHLILDATYHPLLLWPVLSGRSSKSRKGGSDSRIEQLCRLSDNAWTRGQGRGTLSSGEGLAHAVRDAAYEDQPVKEKGQPTGDTVRVLVDSGVEDKRLFLVQSEFGAMLRIMAREGNSLSGVLRDAWDGKDLCPMTKAHRVRATAPHIALVGHITQAELQKNLTETEAFNGFGNRFLWLLVKRSKEVPLSSSPEPAALQALALRIRAAVQAGRRVGRIEMTEDAQAVWCSIYHDLSRDRPGLVGSLLARGEAYVQRLAALYCLLDGQRTIDRVHLLAALAIWQYAEESAVIVFGDATGDADADVILRAVRMGELSDSDISIQLFGRHRSQARLTQAKLLLQTAGLIHSVTIKTGGRSERVWRVGAAPTTGGTA